MQIPTDDILAHDNIAVSLVNLDEGNDGDYDPADPDDVNLLRFDVYEKIDGEWTPVEGGSYCTQTPASIDESDKKTLLDILVAALHSAAAAGVSLRHRAAELSWLGSREIECARKP